jgi:hypothetical protein
MTAGHLLFVAAMTACMLVAVVFEERDLIAHFGRQYEEYRRRMPMFIPWHGELKNPRPSDTAGRSSSTAHQPEGRQIRYQP